MERSRVLIGIPAYNEEQNIGLLLADLISQNTEGLIYTFFVVSDCSSDRTSEVVSKVGDKRVLLSELDVRTGLAGVENIILERAVSYDALVIINADMRILDKNFLLKIIRPVINDGFNLASCSLRESEQTTFVGKALSSGNRIKRAAFKRFRNGDNWFNCHGGARAFSKSLISQFRFKEGVWEDLFSYLFVKKNGFRFKFVEDTEVIYSIPDNLQDHFKQGARFFTDKKYILDEFGSKVVDENSGWPVLRISAVSFIEFIRNPIYSVSYLGIFLLTLFKNKLSHKKETLIWDSSKSTRRVKI